MTEQQFRDKYVGKAVHCDTEEKAKELLTLAHSFGWTWPSGESLIEDTNWCIRKKHTCYSFDNNKTVGYARLDYYKSKGYEIVEFESEEKKVKKTKKVFDLGLFIDDSKNKKISKEMLMTAIQEWALECHGLTKKEMSEKCWNTHDVWMKEVEVKVSLTEHEIESLKALKVLGFNWIARDKNNELCAYNSKPTKNSFEYDTFDHLYYLKKYLFTFITWQDEEPTNIEELLCGLK